MRQTTAGFLAFLLSAAGIAIAAHLTYLHLGLTQGQIIEGIGCGQIGSALNCHGVIASPIAQVFGLPLSIWGLLGYLVTLSLGFVAWQFPDWSAKALTALFVIAVAFVLIDVDLFWMMVTQIQLVCPMCLLSYAVNLALAWCAKKALPQRWSQILREAPAALFAFWPRRGVAVVWIIWGVVATGAAGVFGVQKTVALISGGSPAKMQAQMLQYVQGQERVQPNTAGDPMTGSPQGAIQMVEFSDYFCPACRQASEFNTIILASRRHEVSLVMKHYPLDQACNPNIQHALHQGACQIAAAAECAHEQGRFWEFHRALFSQRRPPHPNQMEQEAIRLGLDLPRFQECLASERGLEAVKRDIEEAGRLGVRSTPTYLINGVRIVGSLPPPRFDAFLRVLRDTER